MKILILTQYFPPEIGAPQNRLYELAVRLKKKGADISVLTAMPNYPSMRVHEGYRNRFYVSEEVEGMRVQRAWIYASPSKGVLRRLMNYYSFVFTAFWVGLFKAGKQDYILCESPPLFLGKTAWLLCKLKGARMIFNVSDLWPESAEKLGIVTNRTFLRMASALEEWLYRRSFLITGQTQGIVKNIQDRFPQKKVYWLPNGVDLKHYDVNVKQADWRQVHLFGSKDFILLYAGIIGHAQGLEVILHAAHILKQHPHIKFILLGSGPEKQKLLELKEELGADQVLFLDPVSKSEMPAIVNASDAALIPLKKLDLFKGAIPSKIFENLGMKKPILLGVEGEAKELFIDEGRCGLAFIPEDADDLADKILQLSNNPELCLQLGNNGLEYVRTKFERNIIADRFWNYLEQLHNMP